MDAKKRYWARIAAGFTILALASVFFFLLFRIDSLAGAVNRVMGILRPFVYGGVLAYILRTPCNFYERGLVRVLPKKLEKLAQTLAIVLTLASGVLVIYLLLCMILPQMMDSIFSIAAVTPDAAARALAWVETRLADAPEIEQYLETAIESVSQFLQNWIKSELLPTLQGMVGGVVGTVTSVVTTLMNILIGLIVCVYALASRKTFARHGRAVICSIFKPKWAEHILEEIYFADRMFIGFFNGKILDSAIVGVLCYIFSLIFGFPNAMLISVIIGVTNIIPCFGPFIGAVPSALLILMIDPIKCLWFLLFILLLQQFDGNILGPRLLAGSIGLSGFWVLFSITLFGGLFGFVGILTGVPIFAVIYDIIRKLVVYGLEKRGCLDVLRESGGGDGKAPPES